MTIASRVADEMGTHVGGVVGYGVRFDFKCTADSVVRYYTDGVLLRETMTDPLLSKYSVIIVDEAHQRSLHSDILLGLLKKIQRKRTNLRIIVTSATLDAMALKNFFETSDNKETETAFIMSVQGIQLYTIDLLIMIFFKLMVLSVM